MTDLEAVPAPAAVPAPSKNAGSQTLDRGIRALEMVAAAPGGMTVQEVADRLEVHRTIAHRLLATLADHHLIARGPDNRFRAGGGLIALASGLQSTLRDTAMPIMRELAEELESTVVLLVREGEEVVGIAVAAPTKGTVPLGLSHRQPAPAGSWLGRHLPAVGAAGAPRRATGGDQGPHPGLRGQQGRGGARCARAGRADPPGRRASPAPA